MPFSPTGISDVQVAAHGSDLFISWSGPVATSDQAPTYQVYVDRRLTWSGSAQRCHVPTPPRASERNIWVEVGVVAAGEAATDFSADLVAPGGRTERATLTWSGGTYLDPTGRDDLAAFLIYASDGPGGSINLAAPVDRVAAYPGGWINDGFGKGGFGEAGFGRAATLYRWESPPLASGNWQFAVVPVDRAGDPRSRPTSVTVKIAAAPRPPAPNSAGNRLVATYLGPTDGRVTLAWLSSPTS